MKDTHRLKLTGWKKIFHSNRKGKIAWVAILIFNKIGFKTKAILRDKEGHYIMIKEHPTKGYNTSKYLCTQHRST